MHRSVQNYHRKKTENLLSISEFEGNFNNRLYRESGLGGDKSNRMLIVS